MPWHFFAPLYAAFVTPGVPEVPPGAAAPLHALRRRFAEGWGVDGSRLDAGAQRLQILHDVRASGLPGCLTAFYALYRGSTRHRAFDPEAAAGDLPRAITALPQVPKGPVGIGERL